MHFSLIINISKKSKKKRLVKILAFKLDKDEAEFSFPKFVDSTEKLVESFREIQRIYKQTILIFLSFYITHGNFSMHSTQILKKFSYQSILIIHNMLTFIFCSIVILRAFIWCKFLVIVTKKIKLLKRLNNSSLNKTDINLTSVMPISPYVF